MPQTPRLALPLLAAGQTQKDVTHNDAILAIDRLVALVVVSRTALAPPTAPAAGQCWIVPAAGAAAWGYSAGSLLHWQADGWLADAPRNGLMAFVADEALMLVHADGWQARWPVAGLIIGGRSVLAAPPAAIAVPTGGSTIDIEARNAIAALLTALQAQALLA